MSSPESVRAALLLTNRLVGVGAAPLTAREFWGLVDCVDPGELLPLDAAAIGEAAGVDGETAQRIRSLLDAATAMSFEQERLADTGITLVSALDPSFPARLRERLGAACPPFLLLAGPADALTRPALGVVGSRDASDELLEVARRAGRAAVDHGWVVVSGLARGVDQAAMWAAADAGGVAIGVPADGILRASRAGDVRRRVHSGHLCLASPYAPDAPFTAGTAMGRNKIVHALSTISLVVAAEEGTGGTWSGAKEALETGTTKLTTWTGPHATDGAKALARAGATPITDLNDLFTLDPTPTPPPPKADPPTQDALF